MGHGPGIVRVLRRPDTVTGHEVVITAEGGALHPGGLHYQNVAPGVGLEKRKYEDKEIQREMITFPRSSDVRSKLHLAYLQLSR